MLPNSGCWFSDNIMRKNAAPWKILKTELRKRDKVREASHG